MHVNALPSRPVGLIPDPQYNCRPEKVLDAIVKQTLDSYWAKHPPSKDDKHFAVQTIVDPTIITGA